MSMKYKALITGSNDDLIDDFFAHMNHIETMTTSNRYADVVKHIKYFAPDVFVYCIYQETKEDYSKIIPIKHLLAKHKLPFVVVGSEEECADFERITANITDLMIEKPLDAEAIQEKLSTFLEEWRKSHPAPKTEPAPAEQTPSAPVAEGPAPQTVAAGQMPAGQMPMGQMPMGQMPMGQMPMGQMPMGQMPMGQMPMGQMPAGRMPAATAPRPAQKKEEEKKPQAGKTASAPPRKRRRRRHTVGKGRILVIDDNPLMLKVIKEHLHEEYDLATATSGKVAFRFLERRQVDLILLDYEMPEEDGPTVLKKLRAGENTADVPVIFLTGISDRKKIQKALMMQPDGYLLKPIDHEKLIKTIKQYID